MDKFIIVLNKQEKKEELLSLLSHIRQFLGADVRSLTSRDEEIEEAKALDEAYRGRMDDSPSAVLHSCYKTASDEFGVWMARRSGNEIKTEIIAAFLGKRQLQYDLLTREEGFNYWFDLDDIHRLQEHVGDFMVPTSEEQLIQVYFSPVRADQPGAEFLTLAELAAKISVYGNLHKSIDLRQLGAIMKKQGFISHRKGHNSTRGYIVLEHTSNDVNNMRDPKQS